MGAMSPHIIPQDWQAFTSEEHGVWDTLFARQMALLPGLVCQPFLDGVARLGLAGPGIPEFGALSARLNALTGWQVVAVPGLIPDAAFFDMLANRIFPAGNFIRQANQLDYLEEPDVFHDVFGHVPLLSDPVFADYMQAYGRGGLRALQFGSLQRLSRLYWYTVEFGLIRGGAGLQLYGAGIVSSASESRFALASPSPNRLAFDLQRVLRTHYRIDDFQQLYFVIDSFDQLRDVTLNTDFGPVYQALAGLPEFAPADLTPGDEVISRGSQAHVGVR
jgi:phenylalanine-4-hydroxylase